MMKKYYKILILTAFLFNSVWAQSPIDYVNPNSGIGTLLSSYSINQVTLNFPFTGQNNWDFSSYSGTKTIDVRIVNPASTPYTSLYPNANMCSQIESNGTPLAYGYLLINNDSLTLLGSAGIVSQTYTNPDVQYKFPFNYGNSFTDVVVVTNGDVETSFVKYVGYGSIKTPAGLFNDVALIREHDIDNLGGNSIDYHWVSIATLASVFNLDSTDQDADYYTGLTTSLADYQDKLLKHYKLNVYPNPGNSNQYIEFEMPVSNQTHLSIFSVDGKKSHEILNAKLGAGIHRFELNQFNLSAGVYFIRLVSGDDKMAKQFIVN